MHVGCSIFVLSRRRKMNTFNTIKVSMVVTIVCKVIINGKFCATGPRSVNLIIQSRQNITYAVFSY